MSEGYAAGINSALRHHQAGRGGQSLSLLLQTVADHPNAFDAWFNLGVVQHLEGLLSAAGVSLQQAITLRPHSAEAHVALGLLFFDRHEVSSAFAEMDRALTLDPHNAETLAQKASMLRNSGDGEEAARYFRKAIQLQPHYGEAYHALASLRKQTRNETHLSRDVEGMEGAYQSSQTSPHDRMLIGFALGKVFDDLGEYDKAFGYFEQANRSQRQSFSYSTERQARFFRRHEEGLGQAFQEHCVGQAVDDTTPIFILGMPRSGTSLVEQILASHPAVFGAGEVEYTRVFVETVQKITGHPFPQKILKIPPRKFKELGRTYIDLLKSNSSGAQRVTDKLPHNFLRIGMLAAVMPHAKIILCERDPVDNCLSIYQQYFAAAHGYASDLTELGEYYSLYRSMMFFWQQLLPRRIYRIGYEELVTDTEQQVNKLLAYCELPFHPSCLSFHETERIVNTPSANQVREPVYRHAIARWRNYESHLEPLRLALG